VIFAVVVPVERHVAGVVKCAHRTGHALVAVT
jgi:hypothetical protein